jgi:predicted MFS family arabinose efflux permease
MQIDEAKTRNRILTVLFGVGSLAVALSPRFEVLLAGRAIQGFGAGGYLLLPLVGAMALASPVAGRLLDHIGAKPVIISGTLLLTAGLSLLGFFAGSLALFIAAGVIIGLGLSSLLGAPLRYIMFQEAGPQDRSAAQGVLAVNTSVGQLIGASAVSAVAASLGGGVSGYGRSYLVIAALSFVLFAAAWWLKGKGERQVSKASGLDGPAHSGVSSNP